MTAYLSKGFETIQYNVIDGNPRQDFMDLVSMTEHHTKALNGTDEEVEAFKPEMLNVVYGTVDGHYRTDQLVNRSVMFIDVDDGGDYDTVLERVTGGGDDVKIMDRFFWHLEVPDSEKFSKPGFQLKTA